VGSERIRGGGRGEEGAHTVKKRTALSFVQACIETNVEIGRRAGS